MSKFLKSSASEALAADELDTVRGKGLDDIDALPLGLSGGITISLSIGMAKGIGLVAAIPSVATLIESRRILLVVIISSLLYSKAFLNVRLDLEELLLFSLELFDVFYLLLELSVDVLEELEVLIVWLAGELFVIIIVSFD